MTFLKADLLLTAGKLSDLDAALSATGIDEPLEYCIEEAIADVGRFTSGYLIDDVSVRGWVRALALHKAYSLAESVPADIQKLYDEAMAELKAIAAGERPNLTRMDADDAEVDSCSWGSADKIDV